MAKHRVNEGLRVERKDRVGPLHWATRIIGATGIAAVLMAPSGLNTSLNSEVAAFNAGIVLESDNDSTIDEIAPIPIYNEKASLTRDTGMDMQPCFDFDVCGTDLGQPFLLPNGDVASLFGDTFKVKGPFLKDLPDGTDKYRAQVMLRSSEMPVEGQPMIFDSAVGLDGKGTAPEFLGQWHILMNDGVSLPNGDIIVSYQHTIEKEDQQEKHTWYTDYAGLAISHDGNTFEIIGPTWENNGDNTDPYQMWSMQRDGDYVYVVSVAAGRQPGPMMLFRSRWDQMLDRDAYEYWNGEDWSEKASAKPIRDGFFGEPSMRKLSDGTWVLSYMDFSHGPRLVTQKIVNPDQGPEGQWSEPKVQLTWRDLPSLYGGGVHPYSTEDDLALIVSTWQTKGSAERIQDRELVQYGIYHLNTSA